ncbi:MAG: BPSS1780 family membrane protein [Burkholderiales bacterium]
MTTFKLATVPARQGSAWARQGFRVFFKRPMVFAALFALFMFAVFVLALLPVVGPLLLLALLPMVTLAFMLATKATLAGELSTPAALFQTLRMDGPRRMAMLKLGVIYALTTFAILWLADFVDGGAFDALMDALPDVQGKPELVAAKLADPRLAQGLMLRTGLTALLSLPFWHAPALVYWGGQGCAQSLFSSTLACWRNKGAFSVYSLTWVSAVMLFATLGSMVFGLLGQLPLFAVAATPFSLMLTTVFYASLYFTFADCFEAATPSVPPHPAPFD